MERQFEYRGEIWKAKMAGGGHGVGTGVLPRITKWQIRFELTTGDGEKEFIGFVSKPNIHALTEDELRKTLVAAKEALLK